MSSEAGSESTLHVATPSLTTVARGVSWKVLGRGIGQLTTLGSFLVLAIFLAPEAFGIVAVGMVIISITTLLMESGTGGAIIVSERLTAADIRGSVVRNLALGLAFSVVVALTADRIVDTFAKGADPAVLRVMIVSVAVGALGIVPLALLDKTLKFKRRAQISVLAALVSSVAAIAAAIAGAGVWALVVKHLANQGLLTAFAWASMKDVWPRGERFVGARGGMRRTGATWFLLMAVSNFIAFSVDNLIVGRLAGVRDLGLYSVAFVLAFAPLRMVSWQVGGALLSAIAATRDRAQARGRTLKSVRLMALMLAPFVAPTIVLAPELIPAFFGERWSGMVVPFQILFVVGVARGVLNILAEALAATGNAAFRGKVDMAWAVTTVGAIGALTAVAGIKGAALAHLAMFFVLAAVYLVYGTHRMGLSPLALGHALAGVGVCLSGQVTVTAAVVLVAGAAGAPPVAAALGAALAGLGAAAGLLVWRQRELLEEMGEVLAAVIRRRPA